LAVGAESLGARSRRACEAGNGLCGGLDRLLFHQRFRRVVPVQELPLFVGELQIRLVAQELSEGGPIVLDGVIDRLHEFLVFPGGFVFFFSDALDDGVRC